MAVRWVLLLACLVAAPAAAAEPDPLCAHTGPPYAVGRISFTGHHRINDSTLRRAMVLRERDVFDVGKLGRSLARINEIGLAEPLAIADVAFTPHSDGVTADITIPLRERGRRWWSLSGPIIPGLGSYQASISARLPPWGRGLLDASTYLVTFNLLGLAGPLLGVLPLLSNAPPAAIALERPFLPGQEFLSGFAVSPQLSARATLAHYGRTQLSRLVRGSLEGDARGDLGVCTPAKPKLWWLRRGVAQATDLLLAVLLH
jgi:hypothetical protein